MDLCVADNASVAMPRKLASLRQVISLVYSILFIICSDTPLYLLHYLNFELSIFAVPLRSLYQRRWVEFFFEDFPMFCDVFSLIYLV